MSFILKGSQIPALQFKSKMPYLNFCTYHDLCECAMHKWSNLNAINETHLKPLYWGLQVTSSLSIWGCVLKGQIVFWRALKTSNLNTGTVGYTQTPPLKWKELEAGGEKIRGTLTFIGIIISKERSAEVGFKELSCVRSLRNFWSKFQRYTPT